MSATAANTSHILDLQKLLIEVGALKTNDYRLLRLDLGEGTSDNDSRSGRALSEDDDWE